MCLYVYHPLVARQGLCKYVTAATNTHATEELLDASFSVWSVSYLGKQVIGSSQNFLLELNNTNVNCKTKKTKSLEFPFVL
jgi:hypothetical protein